MLVLRLIVIGVVACGNGADVIVDVKGYKELLISCFSLSELFFF